MKKLKRICVVQFFLYDAEEFEITGHAAFLGQNGSGKTSLLDAIQIAMLGAHETYLAFNSQSVGTTTGRRSARSIRDYCLGVVDDTGAGDGRVDRKRDHAVSYITLVFEDDITREPVSLGVCLRADGNDPSHEVLGLYVLPGQSLRLADHLEGGQSDVLPLLWNDFEAAIRKRYLLRENTSFIGTQPTKYIHEMIHALQPKAKSIDVREYLKVFRKSMLLRNIESVDAFVRDYVVEPQSIDRRRARSQIEHFKTLSRLVEQVRQQILDLNTIAAGFDELQKFVSRSASTKALAARYSLEEELRQLSELEKGIRQHFKSRKIQRIAAANFANRVHHATVARDEALTLWRAAPGANDASNLAQSRFSAERSYANTRRRIESDLSQLSSVIDYLATHKTLPVKPHDIKEAARVLTHNVNRFEQGQEKGIDKVVSDVATVISKALDPISTSVLEAQDRIDAARSSCAAITGQVRNADRNGAPISDDVARIIERLLEAGIEASPVCNIVEITDAAWQPAIEAFLKSNRESLVVADGRERDAIRLIRRMPASDNPFTAKVVQPHHLKDHRWNESDTSLVGNLFTSNNPVALAYLRSLMGSMKMVETEEELEQHSRALTVDGMLSANFTTSRLRLYPAERLLFGKRLTYAEKEQLRKKLLDAVDEENSAKTHLATINEAIARITKLGDLANISARTIDNVAQVIQEHDDLEKVKEKIGKLNVRDITPLKEDFDRKDAHLKNEQKLQSDNGEVLASTETSLRQLYRDRAPIRLRRDIAQKEFDALMEGSDVDQAWIDRVRGEIDASQFGASYQGKIQSCKNRIESAERSIEAAHTVAVAPFQSYLSRNNVSLDAEVRNWRLAKGWVDAERKRLTETELAERREDVALARSAAEEAFRNDVAVRIRESIDKMKKTIDDINNTLQVCPAFSNGERYKFVCNEVEAHKQIHQYINNVGRANERDMFELGDGVAHEKIMQLLEDTGTKDQTNPLDDYRLLYSFDLMILRPEKPPLPLSRRLGVGSNGEHRTPFYVIAGAAMAAAYRIDAGKHSTGAGLMLLDEAFHGMDQQNALAAARFLDSIGLQMIMAAPESEHSKLAPALDTVYELNRFDMDVYAAPTFPKAASHELLTSDMPSEHPDLLEKMIAELEASNA